LIILNLISLLLRHSEFTLLRHSDENQNLFLYFYKFLFVILNLLGPSWNFGISLEQLG